MQNTTRPALLVIEDDPDLAGWIGTILVERGYEVRFADRKAEGWISRLEPELSSVLLDLSLSAQHGRELLERLRRERPELPVVVFSHTQEVNEVVHCMRLGAVDYLAKPLDEARLLFSVASACERHVSRQSPASQVDAWAAAGTSGLSMENASESYAPILGKAIRQPGDIPRLADIERDLIHAALSVTHWNIQEASRRLGIGRATVYRKIQRYGLERRPKGPEPASR